jgi:hypothetical protein
MATCSHPEVFRALSKTQDMEILSLPFVEAIVRHTWTKYKALAFIDIIISAIVLAVALYTSVLIQKGEWTALDNAWAVIVLGCGTGKRFVEEVSQLLLLCSYRSTHIKQAYTGRGRVKFPVKCLGLFDYMKDSWHDCLILSVSVKGWLALFSDDI